MSSFGNWLYLWIWGSHGVGNYMDDLTILLVASVAWPPLRRRIHRAIDAKLAAHHAALKADLTAHHEAMKAHVADAITKALQDK